MPVRVGSEEIPLAELAARTGKCENWWRNMAAQGRIPFARVFVTPTGKRSYFFHRAQFEQWWKGEQPESPLRLVENG